MKISSYLFACCALCVHLDSRAAQFSLFLYEAPATLAKRATPAATGYWQAYDDIAAAMIQAGVLRGGSALSRDSGAPVRTVLSQPGDPSPRLSGYFVIEVPDLAAARQWAARMPASAFAVDVLPHLANPTMAAKN